MGLGVGSVESHDNPVMEGPLANHKDSRSMASVPLGARRRQAS